LEAYYASHQAEVTQDCLNVVVADTEANAQTLHDEIAAGTSFTTAAGSAAADQQVSPTGGELQCEYPATVSGQFGSTVGPTVLALKTGQLSAPLTLETTSSAGTATALYAVVQMRARQLVPFATLRSSIRQAILTANVAVVSKALNRLVGEARVSVDPRYGTWSAKGGVTVPTPPVPAFVLNAPANLRPKPLLSAGGLSITPSPG
jgi:predicted solute-binding protein